jgi:hypothetical protein
VKLPRALMGSVMCMARPARPRSEAAAVREAASVISAETGLKLGAPISRAIARRVGDEMRTYLSESDDPFMEALGETRRRFTDCPFVALATDPAMDALSLFVEARVERLRVRSGRGLPERADQAECRALMEMTQTKLAARYLRHLRKG